MTDTWVCEEAGRQLLAWRSSKYDPSERTLAESCLRAGLLEAARQLEVRAADIRTIWPDGDHEEIVKTWDIAAADVRAFAGEEPKS